jgi:hypothetical protein
VSFPDGVLTTFTCSIGTDLYVGEPRAREFGQKGAGRVFVAFLAVGAGSSSPKNWRPPVSPSALHPAGRSSPVVLVVRGFQTH